MTTVTGNHEVQLGRKDFVSDQEVRWCPGCGDYSILAQTQKLMPDLGLPKEKIVFISGIGCSSRLPYYMNTYGFHTIHGRAPAITGDGDGLSIGGNHLLHAMRRNVDLNIVLFNNRIYGLTKGQYSPTSELGKRTKSSPAGTIEHPVNPLEFAIGCGATFIARSLDNDTRHLIETLERAAHHKGTSFVEVLQNCVVYNDDAFAGFADRAVRPDRTITLQQGQPVVFGKEQNLGLRLNGVTPEVVDLSLGNVSKDDLLVHDENREDPTIAFILSRMQHPESPVPLGVLRAVQHETYEDLMVKQLEEAESRMGAGDLEKLFAGEDTWEVA
jgi:2-oxoglutarate/2-oxoacid ferredoxin oxidoreductase subunit beta